MTGKRKKGSSVRDVTVEILISIRDEIRQTNARLDGVTSRLDDVTSRLDDVTSRLDGVTSRLDGVTSRLDEVEAGLAGLRHETRDGLAHLRDETRDGLSGLRQETRDGLKEVHDHLSRRLDKLIENTGEHWRNIDTRVARLEVKVEALGHS